MIRYPLMYGPTLLFAPSAWGRSRTPNAHSKFVHPSGGVDELSCKPAQLFTRTATQQWLPSKERPVNDDDHMLTDDWQAPKGRTNRGHHDLSDESIAEQQVVYSERCQQISLMRRIARMTPASAVPSSNEDPCATASRHPPKGNA